ncbi:Ribonuclease P protein component [gamma proteobacterium HdN1]|nr:Ribonuclease P protein component [gamma proteobacterium HdN1]
MPVLGFSRELRLTQKKEYDQVFAHASFKFGCAQFLVLASFRNDALPARLGLVASKKHLKNSVNRNRFKRQARESFRKGQMLLTGCDIVVLSRTQALDANEIPSQLDQIWLKLAKKRAHVQRAISDNPQGQQLA